MRTRLAKRLCIGLLFAGFVSWRSMAHYELAFRVVGCAGAAVLAFQAFRAAKRRWTADFLEIIFLFNPAISHLGLAGGLGPVAIGLAAAPFAVSSTALKSQPLLAIPSVSHGSQSGE